MPFRGRVIADLLGRPGPVNVGTGITAVSATSPLVLSLVGSTIVGSIDQGSITHNNLGGRSTAAAHPASAVTNAPAGSISAATVQAALNELDTEKAALSGATFTGLVNTSGASGGLGFLPRDGSGTTFTLYNPTGDDLRLSGATDLAFITSAGALGLAESSPLARLHLSQDGTSLAPAMIDAYGTTAQIISRTAGGTKASPSATAANTLIGGIAARGYGATGWSPAGRGVLGIYAAETWTDSAQGTYLRFMTVAAGATTLSERVRITDTGRVQLNTTAELITGTGSPEGVVTAVVGSLFLRTDGGSGTTLYVKQSGTGNTGWGAK